MWINVKDIADGAKFYAGAAIKIMSTPRGLEEGNFIPEVGLVYLVSDNASDKSYFNCVCLSRGEEDNVICRPGERVTAYLEARSSGCLKANCKTLLRVEEFNIGGKI